MMNTVTSRSSFRTLFLGGGAVLGIAVFLFQVLACQRTVTSAVDPPKDQSIDYSQRIADLLPPEKDLVEVFQRVSPGVVNVSNLTQTRVSWFSSNVQEIPRGTGTGFVWDKKGHIVTNYHVIAGADSIVVNFDDQTMKRARKVGEYPSKDLAVLKVDMPPDQLVPIVPGRSRDLMVGQMVLAIGNPYGLDHTLTTGVVSALGREIRALNDFPIQDVIQTDASINPGNSGGPLLDSRGRLIGVNTAIFSPSGGSAGIGFAIPVDTVTSIVTQLIEKGKVERPGLGVAIYKDSESYRIRAVLEEEGVKIPMGVILRDVGAGSAAGRSGLQGTVRLKDGDVRLGDIITAIGDKKVASTEDLLKAIDKNRIGETVEVTFWRDGGERKTKVQLQSLSEN